MADESLTFPELLRKNRDRLGDVRAIVTEDRSITHGALDNASHALARRLVAAGCGTSSRIGLLAPNGIEWAVTASAAMRIGAVLVPLSTLLRPPELLAQLNIATVTHLIAVSGFRGRDYVADLEAAAPGLLEVVGRGGRHVAAPSIRAVWALPDVPDEMVPSALVDALEVRVRPADDLVVLFTSGSRGRPKGTIHTHGGALRAVAAGLPSRCIDRGTVLYIPMPFFWTGGLAAGLLSGLVAGATLLTESEPEPAQTLALLEAERATLFRGWPDQAARLASHPRFGTTDLTSLGDGSLPAVLPAERRPAPGARPNVFGMTESFGPYCGDRVDQDLPDLERGSCGRPFDGVEVRIVDAATGRPAVVDELGEIWLRGPNLLRGLCGRERAAVFTVDGWYPTGDLGRLDGAGYLWYSGRLDDMFKVKGATVYPSEVEAALRSLGEVREAYVTDVEGVDGSREVGALVITDAPVERLAAGVRERLSTFKVPTRWLVRSDPSAVPMLATGKVDPAGLRTVLSASEREAGTE